MGIPLLDLAPPLGWTPWWAAVACLVGLSVGGFVLALPGRAFGMPRWQRVSRLGLLVALAAGIAAPACMLAALPRPDRVGLLYDRADGASWLTTGAKLMPAYLAALVVFAWTTLRRDLAAAEGRSFLSRLHRAAALGGGGAPRLRMLAMLLAGALSFGLMRAVAVELLPAWDSALLPWHLAVTALAAALGAVLVLDRLAGGARDAGTMALFTRGAAGVLVLGMMLGREPWHSPAVLAEAAAALLALVWPARLGWLVGLLAVAVCGAVRWDLVVPGPEADLRPALAAAWLVVVLLAGIAALAPVMGPRRTTDKVTSGSRRLVLRAGAAGAALAAVAASFRDTADRFVRGADAAPRPLAPEARVDPASGAVTPNPGQFMAHVACPGCAYLCGARLRVERVSGEVLRITGNPFHPGSADPVLPAAATLRAAFASLSRRHESGLAQRAGLCARGAALPPQGHAERLRAPLKRSGPRGSGGWEPIALDQLVREVVDGGNPFGEGQVAGLRALRAAGQDDALGLLAGRDNGRLAFAQSFFAAYGRGGGIAVRDVAPPCPDLREANFVVIFGSTLPEQPLLARRIALRRAEGQMVTVLADAVLGPGDNVAAGAGSRWLPVRPATGAVLARAMARRIRGQAAAEDASAICGVAAAEIAALADAFAAHGRHAAAVAGGPVDAETALALHALNAAAGNPAPMVPPPALPPDRLKAVFLWGCDAGASAAAPLVVAVSAVADETTRQADYIVPDTLPFESWGWRSGPGGGVTTSWPVTAPPGGVVGMEGFLDACGRAMGLPALAADPPGVFALRAIAGLAEAEPAMPGISDDDLALSGLERIRPALEAALGERGWRRAAFLLARGGRFDGATAAPDRGFAGAAGRQVAAPSPAWPFLLAVRGGMGPAAAVAVHAEDAAALGLRAGETVTVQTPAGAYSGRLLVRQGVMRGAIAVSEVSLRDGLPARLQRA